MSDNLFMFIWGVLLGYVVNDIITGILAIIHQRDKNVVMEKVLNQIEKYDENHAKKEDGETKS